MAILLDTGFLFALFNIQDENHLTAKSVYKDILDNVHGIPYLIDYVFDELMTLIQARTKRNDLATAVGNELLNDAKDFLNFVYVTEKTFSTAWNIFKNQSGQKFLSFTDCIIISCSQNLDIPKIASFDQLFRSRLHVLP